MHTTTGTWEIDADRLEWARWQPGRHPTRRVIVLLHEGLGSVGLWRDWPPRLAEHLATDVFAWSRAGHGGSSPCALPRPLDWLVAEADRVLPALLARLDAREVVLFGHSDGGSIALAAAGGEWSLPRTRLRAVIALAPHVFVEPITLEAIRGAVAAFESGDLRTRLARHHGENTDCAFRGWSGAWLDPAFAHWNLFDRCAGIHPPLLLVQGHDDPYGSLDQLAAIGARARGPCRTVALADCGHAPHQSRPDAVLHACARFLDPGRAGATRSTHGR